MSDELMDALEEAQINKNFGISATKTREFEKAVHFFSSAVKRLEPHVRPESVAVRAPTHLEKKVASQLADCYGSLGGALRRNNERKDSVTAYDKGFDIEANEHYGIINSYNRVQRLVARILVHEGLLDSPESLKQIPVQENTDVFNELVAARQLIQRQINGTRHSDRWAMADEAMTSLLIGDYATADMAWARFEASKPSPEAYQSTQEVIAFLLNSFAQGRMKDALEATFKRLSVS